MFNLHLLILSCLLFSRAIAEDAYTFTTNWENEDTWKYVDASCSHDCSYEHYTVTLHIPLDCGGYPHGCKDHHDSKDHHGCKDHHDSKDHHGCKDHHDNKDHHGCNGSKDDKNSTPPPTPPPSPPPLPPPLQCKSNYFLLGKNCYYINTGTITWNEAFQRCRNLGGSLAFPLNAEEDNLIRELAKSFYIKQGGWWLGGTDSVQEGVWKWSHSQEKIIYTNWLPKQPDNKDNEDCLGYSGTVNTPNWNDYACSAKLAYICQSEPIAPV